jgi:hypothetical protein
VRTWLAWVILAAAGIGMISGCSGPDAPRPGSTIATE